MALTKKKQQEIADAQKALNDFLNEPGEVQTSGLQIPQKNVAGDWEYKTYITKKIILENQPDKHGLHWVYVLIDAKPDKEKKRIRKKFNTAVQVSVAEWDKTKEMIKPQCENQFERNTRINTLFNKINTTIIELRTGKYVELSTDLKDLESIFGNGLKKEKARTKSLTDYIDDYVAYRKKRGTPRGTYKEFITVKNRLQAYEHHEKTTIYFKDINLILSDNLISYWSSPDNILKKSKTGAVVKKPFHPNTIKKTFEVLITVLNYYYARKDELHIDLSDKFKLKEFGEVKEYQQEPIALDDDEVKLIVGYNFEDYYKQELDKLEQFLKKEKIEFKRKFLIKGLRDRINGLELTRDRILLQISTGLRVGDLFTIQPHNVGKEVITISPEKTRQTKKKNQTNIKLFPLAKKVLAKYHNDTTKKPFKVADQNYNKSIKDLLEIVGIDSIVEVLEFEGFEAKKVNKKKFEVMTSHNFRDTFITTAIRKNVPISIILEWTNQSSYEVMKKYINLTKKDLQHHVDMFS